MFKEIKKEYGYLMFFVGLFLVGGKKVFADSDSGGGTFANPLGEGSSIAAIVVKILDFIAQIGAIVAVFFVIYAGFLFVTASGNEAKLSKAKLTLFWTVIGALILVGAKVLSEVVCNTATSLGANADCGQF